MYMGSYKRAKRAYNQEREELESRGEKLLAKAAELNVKVDLDGLSPCPSVEEE